MTAFSGYIEKEYSVLYTDTLSTYPKEVGEKKLKPRSYLAKNFILPQFKSAFSVTGTLQSGLCYFNLITESAFGIDVDSLINIDLEYYRGKLKNDYPQFPYGTIYLTGYSNQSECFKGYKLIVNKQESLIWQEMQFSSLIFKPGIENWEDKLSENGQSNNLDEVVIKLMKIQKEEDEQKPLDEQVGIGGQILATKLQTNKESKTIQIVSEIIHEFDDFEDLGEEMIKK